MAMWMVRAGRGAEYIDDFVERSIVAIGWADAGELRGGTSREDVLTHFSRIEFRGGNRNQLSAAAGQVFRFLSEIKVNDDVVTYDSRSRTYHVGVILSEPRWAPDVIERLPRVRDVRWERTISRDDLGASSRNSLGAISTLFSIGDETARELGGEGPAGVHPTGASDGEGASVAGDFDGMREQAFDQIKDRIAKLDGDDFERLVAALLRAMGYKTRVTPKGPDRGVDIIASPDGFGFEQPRIVVECKHRPKEQIRAPDIRSFLGGRHADDKGMYVSTGGFTKDARYEAERAAIPLALMDFEQLVLAIVEHYEAFDSEGGALLPLGRLFWPV